MSFYLDLSAKRPAHLKPAQTALAVLPMGDKYVHDHSDYATSFSVWIAQLRKRLGRGFRYESIGKNRYAIYPTTEVVEKEQIAA